MITSRDFDKNEVMEISRYILSNVPYSVLETLFPLTERAINKITVFTITYRIINSAKNYVNNQSTRRKLNELLNQTEKVYTEVYYYLSKYEETIVFKDIYLKKINNVLNDYNKNLLINNLIDVFLVFAEKQQLFDIDKITGLEVEKKGSEDIIKKLTEE